MPTQIKHFTKHNHCSQLGVDKKTYGIVGVSGALNNSPFTIDQYNNKRKIGAIRGDHYLLDVRGDSYLLYVREIITL